MNRRWRTSAQRLSTAGPTSRRPGPPISRRHPRRHRPSGPGSGPTSGGLVGPVRNPPPFPNGSRRPAVRSDPAAVPSPTELVRGRRRLGGSPGPLGHAPRRSGPRCGTVSRGRPIARGPGSPLRRPGQPADRGLGSRDRHARLRGASSVRGTSGLAKGEDPIAPPNRVASPRSRTPGAAAGDRPSRPGDDVSRVQRPHRGLRRLRYWEDDAPRRPGRARDRRGTVGGRTRPAR